VPSPAKPVELRASPAQVLELRAKRYAGMLEQDRSVLFSVVTFRRGAGTYALPLTALKEIRVLGQWCVMPGASPVVPGVVHCRGELLSLHDLSSFANRESTLEREAPSWVLVAEHRGRRLGVMADDVMDVLEVEVGALRTVPITLGDAVELFVGMLADGVLVVDSPRMFDVPRFAKAY